MNTFFDMVFWTSGNGHWQRVRPMSCQPTLALSIPNPPLIHISPHENHTPMMIINTSDTLKINWSRLIGRSMTYAIDSLPSLINHLNHLLLQLVLPPSPPRPLSNPPSTLVAIHQIQQIQGHRILRHVPRSDAQIDPLIHLANLFPLFFIPPHLA